MPARLPARALRHAARRFSDSNSGAEKPRLPFCWNASADHSHPLFKLLEGVEELQSHIGKSQCKDCFLSTVFGKVSSDLTAGRDLWASGPTDDASVNTSKIRLRAASEIYNDAHDMVGHIQSEWQKAVSPEVYFGRFGNDKMTVGGSSPEHRPQPAKEPLRAEADIPPATISTGSQAVSQQLLTTHGETQAVPVTQFSRAVAFTEVGLRLGMSALKNKITGSQTSLFDNEKNMSAFVNTFCKLRGTALKFAQMLSIQDSSIIPPGLLDALGRVRDSAFYMPTWQVEQVLSAEFNSDWRKHFAEFDFQPIAAASIGQVHGARLVTGEHVAVKVQYPGIRDAIKSDIRNLSMLFKLNILPAGMFIQNVIREMENELLDECDYTLELSRMTKYRDLLHSTRMHQILRVPRPFPTLCTQRILTTEYVKGVPIEKAVLGADERSTVGVVLLELTLTELFKWRFMQTDPNWSNFLYDQSTGVIHLLDFGAAREFDKSFVDGYAQVVISASNRDREGVIAASRAIGLLTPNLLESASMLDAHCEAAYILGEPFSKDAKYDFGKQRTAERLIEQVQLMLKQRIQAPPKEVYSLHRRLSGLFLILAKLGCNFNPHHTFSAVLKS